MSLSLTSYGCLFSLFPALSICADTRVGNAVGRGNAADARRAMRTAALLSLPTSLLVSMVSWPVRIQLWWILMPNKW